MGFPRQEYWSGLPLPTQEGLPGRGIIPVSPVSPALQADSLLTELHTEVSAKKHVGSYKEEQVGVRIRIQSMQSNGKSVVDRGRKY